MAQPKADFAGLPSNITTCAVVGNAGHLRQKLYGPHIDNHDVVVRFNLVHKESLQNVTGHKVSLRFINHASATHLCKLSRPWENVRYLLAGICPYALTTPAAHSVRHTPPTAFRTALWRTAHAEKMTYLPTPARDLCVPRCRSPRSKRRR
jgi:hypothetical protein